MNRTRRILAACLMLLGAALVSLPAAAQDDAEAVFARGQEKYAEGRIQAALDDYRAAYKLGGDYRVMANRGNAAYQLGLYAEAAAMLREALRDLPPAAENHDELKAKMIERLAQAREKAGELVFQVDPQGAEVYVDDAPVDVTESHFVMPGERQLRVTLDGYEDHVVAVQAKTGAPTPIVVSLKRAVSPISVSQPNQPTEDAGTDDNTVEYVLGIGSLVLGAGAVVGGVAMLLAANSEGESADALAVQVNADAAIRGVAANACADGPVVVAGCADLTDSRDLQDTLTGGAVAMMIVGGALAVTGGVLVGIAATSDSSGDIAVVLSPTGLGLKGTF